LSEVTASHRSAIAWSKATERALGKALVCGRAPAPGATGRAASEELALALGAALALLFSGGVAGAADGDPGRLTLVRAVGGG
jgi:hypothetical protein